MASSSASIVHTCRRTHALTHWPSPIRLEHSDVELGRAPLLSCNSYSAMPYALLDPRFLTLSPLSLTLFSLPPLRPLLPVFRLDDVDEPHVAVLDVTFGRPCLTLVMLATPGWCHVPLFIDGLSLRGVVHIMLSSKLEPSSQPATMRYG